MTNVNLDKEPDGNPGLVITVNAVGGVEEIQLPFHVPAEVIAGRMKPKTFYSLISLVVGFITAVTLTIVVVDTIWPQAPEGSLGYNLGIGAVIVWLLLGCLFFHLLGEKAVEESRTDSFHRRTDFARSTFAPWLEKHGFNESDAYFSAMDLMEEKKHSSYLKNEDNVWGAFDLEFSVHGFRKRHQKLRIWRWGKP